MEAPQKTGGARWDKDALVPAAGAGEIEITLGQR
jgi:hypothetical protein